MKFILSQVNNYELLKKNSLPNVYLNFRALYIRVSILRQPDCIALIDTLEQIPTPHCQSLQEIESGQRVIALCDA
jgi:hypothetical protein